MTGCIIKENKRSGEERFFIYFGARSPNGRALIIPVYGGALAVPRRSRSLSRAAGTEICNRQQKRTNERNFLKASDPPRL